MIVCCGEGNLLRDMETFGLVIRTVKERPFLIETVNSTRMGEISTKFRERSRKLVFIDIKSQWTAYKLALVEAVGGKLVHV